jgi:adenylate cyclase
MRAFDTHTFQRQPNVRLRVHPPMPPSKVKRKLTTILCADVQGYSAMMGVDETQTLERLQRYRGIMGELFERHDGRKVNTWGDAVIAEFASVVEAVRCAVEIQDAIGAENASLPEQRQMRFRIGINLGDVMQDGADLYGDGVNVAARLEALADPGGIMVSETVYDLTHRQLSFAYDFAGEQMLKGQDRPIAGYKVRMDGSNQQATQQPTLLDDAPTAQPTRLAETIERLPPDLPGRKPALVDRLLARLQRSRHWYLHQPRAIRVPVGFIAMFATINLMTSGLSDIWFIYPSAPFAAFLAFRYVTGTLWPEKN